MIKINAYRWNIKHSEFSERLGKANHFLDRQYDKEGDKNTLPKLRHKEPSGKGCQWNLPVKSTSQRSRDPKGRTKQARHRSQSRLTDVSKSSSDASPMRGTRIASETGWQRTPQPKKQTNKTKRVMKYTPIKSHSVRWTPPTSHTDLV